MTRVDLVLIRYDNPSITFGVHYDQTATLCQPENLNEYFELGNEISFTVEDIWNQIPLEWKHESVTDEWILSRVTVYDKITRKSDA